MCPHGNFPESCESCRQEGQERNDRIKELKELQEQAGTEKERQWLTAQLKMEKITDGLGLPVDKGIKESVASLMAHDFPLDGSCEGHLDRGSPYPWIDVYLEIPKDKLALRGRERVEYVKEMRAEHQPYQDRLQKLLDEFYQDHSSANRFVMEPRGIFGAFRIEPAKAEAMEAQTDSDVKEADLEKAREEMLAFAELLKARFLEG